MLAYFKTGEKEKWLSLNYGVGLIEKDKPTLSLENYLFIIEHEIFNVSIGIHPKGEIVYALNDIIDKNRNPFAVSMKRMIEIELQSCT